MNDQNCHHLKNSLRNQWMVKNKLLEKFLCFIFTETTRCYFNLEYNLTVCRTWRWDDAGRRKRGMQFLKVYIYYFVDDRWRRFAMVLCVIYLLLSRDGGARATWFYRRGSGGRGDTVHPTPLLVGWSPEYMHVTSTVSHCWFLFKIVVLNSWYDYM
jgi:hypothetical protein